MSTKVFLGFGGRAYGPFGESEIESMQADGTFARFHWIWDESNRIWQALDPAPAPIITKAGISKDLPFSAGAASFNEAPAPERAPVSAPAPKSPPSQRSRAVAESPAPEPMPEPEPAAPETPPAPVIPLRPRNAFKEKTFQALCHNHSAVVSGSLRQYSESEGELVCEDESAAPALPTTIPVLLNLLDEKSGKQSSLQATVTQIKRGSHGWHYTLKLAA